MNFTTKIHSFFRENRVFCIIFLLLFIITGFTRFVDILKFLPDYSIDENDIVEFGVGFMGKNYEPFWYKYGPLYGYILSFIYRFLALFDSRPTDVFAQDVFFNPTVFYYTARFVNSCFNILLAFMAFRIAGKVIGEKLSRYVLLIAILPIFDFFTGFTVRVDTLLAICVTFSIWYMIRITETGKTKYYLLCGLFLGLGIATKPLPSLLILPTLFLTHFWYQFNLLGESRNGEKKREKKPSVISDIFRAGLNYKFFVLVLVAIFSNIFYNPYLFKRFGIFKKEQIEAVATEGSRAFDSGLDITRFFGNMGYILTIIGIIAVVYLLYCSIKQKNIKYFLITSYPIVFWLAFSFGAARTYFYIPIVIFIIIAAVKFIADMSAYLPEKYRQAIFITGIGLIMIQPLYMTVFRIYETNRHGKYSVAYAPLAAKSWIEANIDRNARIIVMGEYTSLPRIVSSKKSLYGYFDEKDRRNAFLGQFFMYGRWNMEYFRNLFIKAHDAYVTDPSQKSFDNIDYMRGGAENMQGNFLGYCLGNQFDYMITSHNLDSIHVFQKRTMRKFTPPEHPFGVTVYIYDLRNIGPDDITQNSGKATDHFLNSQIYNRMGEQEKMKEALSRCIDLSPTYPNARFNRGVLYFREHDFAKAVEDFVQTTKQEPKNPTAYYNAGLCYYYMNDLASTRTFMKKAKDLGYKEAENILKSLDSTAP